MLFDNIIIRRAYTEKEDTVTRAVYAECKNVSRGYSGRANDKYGLTSRRYLYCIILPIYSALRDRARTSLERIVVDVIIYDRIGGIFTREKFR